jgi:hypothetical protein
MKKLAFTLFLAISLLFTLLPTVFAAPKSYGILDKQSNRTYVPIRFISEQLKYDLEYEPKAKTITIRNQTNTITLQTNKKQMTINNDTLPTDAAPFLEDGVTYVPLSVVTAQFGVDMNWNSGSATVELRKDGGLIKLPVITDRAALKENPIKLERNTYVLNKRKISATLLIIDLLHSKIDLTVGLAKDKVGSVADLQEIAKQNNAIAAMNGTFFDAYTESAVKDPYAILSLTGK